MKLCGPTQQISSFYLYKGMPKNAAWPLYECRADGSETRGISQLDKGGGGFDNLLMNLTNTHTDTNTRVCLDFQIPIILIFT